jgi:hypothetical protein
MILGEQPWPGSLQDCLSCLMGAAVRFPTSSRIMSESVSLNESPQCFKASFAGAALSQLRQVATTPISVCNPDILAMLSNIKLKEILDSKQNVQVLARWATSSAQHDSWMIFATLGLIYMSNHPGKIETLHLPLVHAKVTLILTKLKSFSLAVQPALQAATGSSSIGELARVNASIGYKDFVQATPYTRHENVEVQIVQTRSKNVSLRFYLCGWMRLITVCTHEISIFEMKQ